MTPSTILRSGVARTIARPAFNQLIPFVNERRGDLGQPDELGNPDLKPQTAWGVDLGIEQEIGNGVGILAINGYYRFIDNLIENQIFQNTVNNRFQQRPINLNNARGYGVEIDLRSRMDFIGLQGLTLINNISFLGSEVEDGTTGAIRRFNDQPSYIFNAGFDYTTPDKFFSVGLNYNLRPPIISTSTTGNVRQIQESQPLQSLDSYITLNFNPKLSLSIYGRNLIPIAEVRPRQFFNAATGVLQSSQSDDQRSDRVFGLSVTYQF